MELCRRSRLLSKKTDKFSSWKTSSSSLTNWTKELFSSLCKNGTTRTTIIGISCGLIHSILCQPALSQSSGLNWMGTFEHPRGSRIEFSNPSGNSCRYEQGSRPSLNLGVGISQGQVLSGYGNNETIVRPRMAEPSPVAGISLHIPLGVDKSGNCKEILKTENAMMKLQYAKQLMMDGLITEEQLNKVIQQTYSVLSEN